MEIKNKKSTHGKKNKDEIGTKIFGEMEEEMDNQSISINPATNISGLGEADSSQYWVIFDPYGKTMISYKSRDNSETTLNLLTHAI